MANKQESAEDILAQLHQDDGSDNSNSDEEDLDIANLKAKSASKKDETGLPDPLSEEK